MDGCFENVKTLQQVIKQQRKRHKEIHIVFLDLAKAFDAMSHIRKGLMKKGVPVQVIETIEEMYTNACAEISVGRKTTRKTAINSGVNQGCPLSPFLFNLVLDELIEKLKSKNIGVRINGSLLNVMAFADDLVVITEAVHMKILLEQCKQFFEIKGLAVNAERCQPKGSPSEREEIDEGSNQNP